eukprot:COSAG05_NODE_11863_length_493_cov_0.545685_1_plen_60_part_01
MAWPSQRDAVGARSALLGLGWLGSHWSSLAGGDPERGAVPITAIPDTVAPTGLGKGPRWK